MTLDDILDERLHEVGAEVLRMEQEAQRGWEKAAESAAELSYEIDENLSGRLHDIPVISLDCDQPLDLEELSKNYSRIDAVEAKPAKTVASNTVVSQPYTTKLRSWLKILKKVIIYSALGIMAVYAIKPSGLDLGRKGIWSLENSLANKSSDEKDYLKALLHFMRAQDWQPNIQTSYDIAQTYLKIGYTQAAEETLTEILAKNPEHETSRRLLADLYEFTGQHEKAISQYQKALEINPNNSTFLNNLAVILDDQKRPDEAEKLYTRSIEIDPQDAIVRVNLGNLLYRKGKVTEAFNMYNSAIGADHASVHAYEWFEVFLLKEERKEQLQELYSVGIKGFTAELERNPTNLPVTIKLADFYQKTGDTWNAQTYLLKAIGLAPEDESLKTKLKELHEKR